jgi:DNA-binding NtrC family response regulator
MKTMKNKIKVLVVDDEVEFASTLAERLELRGFQAKSANCGEDAIACVISSPPHVVVLDIEIPDINGYQIFETIKETNPKIEVILMTGYGSIKPGIDGMIQGAFDFLMKPVSMTTLLEKIQQAWQKTQEQPIKE